MESTFVVCLTNTGFEAALETRKVYRLLPDSEAARDGLIRVIDESGEDYLYPSAMFEPISISERAVKAFAVAG